MAEVTFKELREAVKALNGMEVEDLNVLRTVGVKKVILEQQFIEEVEKLAPDHEDSFPDVVVKVFNDLISDDEDNGDDANDGEGEDAGDDAGEDEKPAGKKAAGKGKAKAKGKGKDKAKAEPKAKKESPRSRYGHIQSAMSGQLDDALYEGGTVQEIMDNLNIKRARVMSHIKHLINDLSIGIEETEADELNDYHFKVK